MSNDLPANWGGPATLSPEVTRRLLADVDVIARRMARQIADVGGLPPEFRRVGYLKSVLGACRDALRTLVRLLEDGRGMRAGDLERLGSMGAAQAERGVPLEILLAAYRLAAKVVWREVMGEAIRQEDLPPATVIAVTENVLEYLDEISGAVGAAYLETRERLMRERDRNRDRVLQRVLAGDASAELRHLAVVSDLDLAPPYRVLAYRASVAGTEGRELDALWRRAHCLAVAESGGSWVVLIPAQEDVGTLCQEATELSGDATRLEFGVGPVAATLAEIGPSAARARTALEIGTRLEPDRAVHSDADVGVFAAMATDPEAMRRFAQRVLGPLAETALPRHRELLTTLEALLAHANLSEAADALGVHRHTIVYRIRGLRELGVDVNAAAERPRLWLALQALRLLALQDPGVAAT